jgi:hypothetical protein
LVIDGRAVDPTWRQPGERYIGVTLTSQEAATRVLETDAFGSLL